MRRRAERRRGNPKANRGRLLLQPKQRRKEKNGTRKWQKGEEGGSVARQAARARRARRRRIVQAEAGANSVIEA